MLLGEKLKNLRAVHDWTQPELAAKANIEQSYLSRLENGKGLPSAEVLDRLLGVFDLTPAAFLADDTHGQMAAQLSALPQIAKAASAQKRAHYRKQRAWVIGSVTALALGLFFGGIAQNAVIFPDRLYRYVSEGVIPSDTKLIFATKPEKFDEKYKDFYSNHGSYFTVDVAGGQRLYSIQVNGVPKKRFENRMLELAGMVFFIAGLAGLLIQFLLSRMVQSPKAAKR
jgi:transcriptional regulator with XRE-family HTH domain